MHKKLYLVYYPILQQNGRLLHVVLMISLGLMKSSEVRKAGDGSNKWLNQNLNINQV